LLHRFVVFRTVKKEFHDYSEKLCLESGKSGHVILANASLTDLSLKEATKRTVANVRRIPA
jgi:hypothetical protein